MMTNVKPCGLRALTRRPRDHRGNTPCALGTVSGAVIRGIQILGFSLIFFKSLRHCAVTLEAANWRSEQLEGGCLGALSGCNALCGIGRVSGDIGSRKRKEI